MNDDKEKILGIGIYDVDSDPTVLGCMALGSCVGIALYSKKKRKGGLAHAMLHYYSEGVDKIKAGKYADTSIYLMLDILNEMGVSKNELIAKLTGGAHMFSSLGSSDTLDIGKRNAEAAKATLEQEGIPLIAEDVGGTQGRTISFDLVTGDIVIKTRGNTTHVI